MAKNEEITLKNTEINQQNDEISAQNDLLNEQKQHLEKAYEQIKTLSDIGQKITSSLNATSIVYTVYEQLNNLMPAECFGIGLLDERAKDIYYPVFIENGEGLPPHRERLDDPRYLSAKCLKEGKPLVINDLYKEYESMTGVALQAEVGSIPHAAAFFPLMLEGKAIGVLTAQSFKENAYQEAETNILRSLASYVAIAMDNADAYEQIEQKNKHITDSIRYAQTIQQALLPSGQELEAAFRGHFVFFRPKDIVSGDFYWLMKAQSYTFVAVADCTGHGVPGAFMSMICQSLLNEAVSERQLHHPEQILFWVNQALMVALKQGHKGNSDGMDIALCRIEPAGDGSEVVFAGAKRPLYYHAGNGLQVLKGSRFSIGGRELEQAGDYAEEAIVLPKGACLYLCSDGLADQNNALGRKFGTPRLQDMLLALQGMDMAAQKASVSEQFAAFVGDTPQRDDISMLAFRI
jgi:serine phosphatase RsbU (regulator of sigma subunit)